MDTYSGPNDLCNKQSLSKYAREYKYPPKHLLWCTEFGINTPGVYIGKYGNTVLALMSEMKSHSLTFQRKRIEQYFPVVLFVML